MVAARRALSLWGVRPPVLLFLSLLYAVVIAPAQELASTSQAETVPAMDFEGRVIGRIEFDPPEQPLPRAELERRLPFHTGSTLHRADIQTAIQSLYDTGRFADIAVDGRMENGAVALRIETQLTYFVSGITFQGVPEPPNKGQLTTATKFELGAPFADSSLPQASENVVERLRANGLYHSRVRYSVERRPGTEEVEIHFTVEPGERARFDGVQLSGDYLKPPQRIIRDTRWHRRFWFVTLSGWREVTERRVQDGVNRVRQDVQRGDHLEAQVTLAGLDYHEATNTVTPSLKIDSGLTVQVRTVGANVSMGRLRQLIPVFQERTVDRGLLVEGQRNLVEYFQSQGYFAAEVNFDEVSQAQGRELIDYRISRGDRSKLADVKISGNHFFDTASIREQLEIRPASFLLSRYGRYSQKLLDRDLEAVRDLYRSSGFRDVRVAAKTMDNYKGKPGQLAVELDVTEGPQWRISKLDLEGMQEAEIPYLRSLLESTEGQPYSDVGVAIDRDVILNYYSNNGYPDATFDWTETPGGAPQTVELHYVVQPGRHEIVRGVLIRGLVKTRLSLVTERVHFAPGDPISQSRIAESQQKLYDLAVFSKVEMAIQNPAGVEDSKYLVLRADEADLYSFNIGFGAQLGRIGGGVTTFDEPAGTTGFVPRISLGVTRLNFLGLAHSLSLQTRFSTIEQRAVLSYLMPQFGGHENLALTISGLFDSSHDIRTFAARRWEGSIQLAQRVSRQYSFQYRFTYRHVTLSDVVVSPELIPQFSQPDRNGQISVSLIQDRRDDPINSTRGMYNTIDAGIALKQFGSDSVFTRILMRNSTYHPLGRRVVIARTLQFGYIQRLGGLAEIPFAERFFSGGASSNRAFPDNQAGPRDLETGFPLGGSALLLHSTELRFPLIGDNLGGVLFHDMGNVYNNVQDINIRFRQRNLQDFGYMVHGFGFGLRYRTPIGPLRADFSLSPDAPRFFGFTGTEEELLLGTGRLATQKINAFQFHFSLGQTF